jgi:hypothetical protein
MCSRFLFAAMLLVSGFTLINAQSRDTLIEVAAQPASGFNFPYFLFIPGDCGKDKETYLLVEPNNTGFVNDTFRVHEAAARVQVALGPLGNYLSRELKLPYLVPVFPRPAKQSKVYTHMLDRNALLIKHGALKRIDLQLIAMIKDAQGKLRDGGFILRDEILMSGFSSSGVFANRFACLHPELVKAYSAGGINGLLMMPYAQWNNEALPYPIGTSDFIKITGEAFNFDAFAAIDQFLYMGDADTHDAIQLDDGYNKNERALIDQVMGKNMLPDRWFACQLQYKLATHRVQFRTYSGVGHEINEDILRDLVRFYSGVIPD